MPYFIRLADRRPRVILVAYCLLCWLPGWFTIPATDRDEARFAQATKQMVETGDFVNIRNGTEARNRKPIGIHWLQAPGVVAARALGLARENPVWPYRIPSLLAALVAVLATWRIGRLLFDGRVALLAAAMLGGSALLTVEAHIAKTDAALLAATTVAMGVLARAYDGQKLGPGRAALFWAALGAGVLLKGPITPMVALLAVAALALADRRAGWLRGLRPVWGMPLMLAIVLPWFVAIGVATEGRFFADAVGGDLGRKVTGGDDAHGAPPGYHLLALSLALFPAAFLVLRALPSALWDRRAPAMRFLLAWAVPAWLVFEAAPTKLPHYPLPLYPALCLLGARWVLAPGPRRTPRWLAAGSAGLFVLAVAVFGGGAAALPVVASPAWSADWLLGGPALLAAGIVGFVVLRAGGDAARATLAALAAVPLLWWAILGIELPNLSALWIAPRVAHAVAVRGEARSFAAVGYDEPSLMFELGTGTRWLAPADAARWLAAKDSRVVAVAAPDRPAFLAASPTPPTAFAESDGFDYSKGRTVRLTLFDRR